MSCSTLLAPSDEEMTSLLCQFDVLQERHKEAMVEARTLRLRISLETQRREAAETLCSDTELEKQRLLRAQAETFNKLLQQLEFRSKFEDVVKELNSLKLQLAKKEEEHKGILDAVSEEYRAENSALHNQIRHSQEELTLRDAAVAHLEQELSCVHSAMNELCQSSLKTLDDQALKYQAEIQNLNQKLQHIVRDKDMLEKHLLQEKNIVEDRLLQEKDGLQQRLFDMEKQLMTERADHEKRLAESNFSRHAEIYKHKIMKLRKENESLRLQLLGNNSHQIEDR